MTTNAATPVWIRHLYRIITLGEDIPGWCAKEVPDVSARISMRQPVMCLPARNLDYKRMVTETHETLSSALGASVQPDLLDDGGVIFLGPGHSLEPVVDALVSDPGTRQAVLSIQAEHSNLPRALSLVFSQRDNTINLHVFMRSSDVWTELPYDIFTFSMLAHLVAVKVNSCARRNYVVMPGTLYLTTASSYLREEDKDNALVCLSDHTWRHDRQPRTPTSLFTNPNVLLRLLEQLRFEANSHKRWWVA